MSLLLLGAGGAVAAGSTTPALLGSGTVASSTAPRLTLSAPPTTQAGDLVIAAVKSTAAAANTFGDDQGNTWSVSAVIGTGSMRLQIARCVLTNPLPAGTLLGPNYGSASAADLVIMVFPAGVAFDVTGVAGAAATSTTPSLALTGIAASPEYAAFGIASNGGLDEIDTAAGWPTGYALIGSVEGGGFGTRLYWKEITGVPAYSETFAPTGHANVAWSLQGITLTK